MLTIELANYTHRRRRDIDPPRENIDVGSTSKIPATPTPLPRTFRLPGEYYDVDVSHRRIVQLDLGADPVTEASTKRTDFFVRSGISNSFWECARTKVDLFVFC
ncbi:hypothetical protein GWI33_016836 [Rhynchophorus ferrugineus]|uniref:Uncharacterized protein n=1 Tax=Rhynchophorus ferrugineus TaxID=354439 RepID=A0A834M6S3_RHYFE|nr:hypothetical protein GWI33_016836 [Rhynchophorus ferrugineus]